MHFASFLLIVPDLFEQFRLGPPANAEEATDPWPNILGFSSIKSAWHACKFLGVTYDCRWMKFSSLSLIELFSGLRLRDIKQVTYLYIM